jgi:hypothetical protein
MKAQSFLMLTVFVLFVSVSIAMAKIETNSQVASSFVMYGKNGDTIVPLKVDTDGTVFIK